MKEKLSKGKDGIPMLGKEIPNLTLECRYLGSLAPKVMQKLERYASLGIELVKNRGNPYLTFFLYPELLDKYQGTLRL